LSEEISVVGLNVVRLKTFCFRHFRGEGNCGKPQTISIRDRVRSMEAAAVLVLSQVSHPAAGLTLPPLSS